LLLKDNDNLGFYKSCLFHDEQLSLKLTLLSNFKLSAIQGYLQYKFTASDVEIRTATNFAVISY